MIKIVLIRHGESVWNKKGLFTGWVDVGLTTKGRMEAKTAGQALKKAKFNFNVALSSLLKRASLTMEIVLREMSLKNIEKITDWRLNERHYGNLQGLNKKEMVKKFGEKQVLIWRRSYSIRPPEITKKNKYNQGGEKKYQNIPIPKAESLKDVVNRIKPFWREQVLPRLKNGDKILISGSGNSLRAMIKYLDKVPAKKILELNIPTGIPLVYELDKNFKPIRHYYLADKKELQAAIDKVKNQGKK